MSLEEILLYTFIFILVGLVLVSLFLVWHWFDAGERLKVVREVTREQTIHAIRHAHKGFRLGSAEAVKEHCEFMPLMEKGNEHLIAYRIKDLEGIDSAKSLIVLLNGGAETADFPVPEANYIVLAHDGETNVDGLGQIEAGWVNVEPYSVTILAEK